METEKKQCFLIRQLDECHLERVVNVVDNDQLWQFLRGWIKKIKNNSESNYAEKFIFLWVTFNAWLSKSVPDLTKNHSDNYLIKSVSNDKKFKDRFKNLLMEDAFKENVEELWKLIPVFQSLWLSNNGLPSWNREVQRETWAHSTHQKYKDLGGDGQFQYWSPKCYFVHVEKYNEKIPCDWPHIMEVIYRIRCNLFHGGKNYNRKEDRLFIKLAYNILWEMWTPEVPPKYL